MSGAATVANFMRTAAVAFLLLSILAAIVGLAIWTTLGSPGQQMADRLATLQEMWLAFGTAGALSAWSMASALIAIAWKD
jgi:hypothetical protein